MVFASAVMRRVRCDQWFDPGGSAGYGLSLKQ